MSDVVVQVDELGKRYQITHQRQRGADSLGEAVTSQFHGLARRLRCLATRRLRMDQEPFWALRDVSFQVKRGEVLGLIGSNGAGKSTLLKLLARITEPTTGRFGLRGRVSSLLEVGTGFHPELSGRENVYLNGAILGMRRAELTKKFDEIVAFAEIDRFIDTPVKRYSSGMYVRLAFAVAAHLEPEILIVDEVLAVGDASFQQKCLGKMDNIAATGRTILFVSHNMQALSKLCSRALLLKNGEIACEGDARQVVESYLSSGVDQLAEAAWKLDAAPGNNAARLRSVRVLNHRGEVQVDHDITKPISIELDFWLLKPSLGVSTSIHVRNSEGLCLFAVGTELEPGGSNRLTEPGLYRTTCRIPGHYFNDGKHLVSAFVVRNHSDVLAYVPDAVSFLAHDYGTGRGGYIGKIIGAVRPLFPWDVECLGGTP